MAIDIEDLLRWAYCAELPKGRAGRGPGPGRPGGGWDRTESYVRLLTTIDENAYGVLPDLGATDEPDPEAVRVHEAVARLGGVAFDGFERDLLISDLLVAGLGIHAYRAVDAAVERATIVDADGDLRLRNPLPILVRSRAVLGTPPDWSGEMPRLVHDVGPKGKPVWRRLVRSACRWDGDGAAIAWADVEVDAPTVNGRLPSGAYRAERLVPDPVGMICRRIEYAAWRSALDLVVDLLGGEARGAHLEPSRRALRPWDGETDTVPAIMPVLGWAEAVDVGGPRRRVRTKRKRAAEKLKEGLDLKQIGGARSPTVK